MKFSSIAPLLAVAAAFLLAVSGPGTRLGLWEFPTGFMMMRWAAYLGLTTSVVACGFLFLPKVSGRAKISLALTVLVGLGVAFLPWQLQQQARSVPPIHDITTDTLNPPEFVAILPLRSDAPNPPEYAGEEVARQQRQAYPDIQPLRVEADRGTAFETALTAARRMGWEIVAVDQDEGRIEATATTFWYGFKDDVVVRIEEDNGAGVIDVRSKSRVGRSDLGANASRIRAYLNAISSIKTSR
ncbi:DUF1499 domain-containing protein [Geoalkalibacter halelectricus]|uniref:DUF1499 domain-containing protein n=1 Tax=Geoalkalibacter halelectricus TaxID=2847045 RepID=UPI003D1B5B97